MIQITDFQPTPVGVNNHQEYVSRENLRTKRFSNYTIGNRKSTINQKSEVSSAAALYQMYSLQEHQEYQKKHHKPSSSFKPHMSPKSSNSPNGPATSSHASPKRVSSPVPTPPMKRGSVSHSPGANKSSTHSWRSLADPILTPQSTDKPSTYSSLKDTTAVSTVEECSVTFVGPSDKLPTHSWSSLVESAPVFTPTSASSSNNPQKHNWTSLADSTPVSKTERKSASVSPTDKPPAHNWHSLNDSTPISKTERKTASASPTNDRPPTHSWHSLVEPTNTKVQMSPVDSTSNVTIPGLQTMFTCPMPVASSNPTWTEFHRERYNVQPVKKPLLIVDPETGSAIEHSKIQKPEFQVRKSKRIEIVNPLELPQSKEENECFEEKARQEEAAEKERLEKECREIEERKETKRLEKERIAFEEQQREAEQIEKERREIEEREKAERLEKERIAFEEEKQQESERIERERLEAEHIKQEAERVEQEIKEASERTEREHVERERTKFEAAVIKEVEERLRTKEAEFKQQENRLKEEAERLLRKEDYLKKEEERLNVLDARLKVKEEKLMIKEGLMMPKVQSRLGAEEQQELQRIKSDLEAKRAKDEQAKEAKSFKIIEDFSKNKYPEGVVSPVIIEGRITYNTDFLKLFKDLCTKTTADLSLLEETFNSKADYSTIGAGSYRDRSNNYRFNDYGFKSTSRDGKNDMKGPNNVFGVSTRNNSNARPTGNMKTIRIPSPYIHAPTPPSPAKETVAPLKKSENRWVPLSMKSGSTSTPDDLLSEEVIIRKVKALLNKLTVEKFDSISAQIFEYCRHSENEKNGQALRTVIRLTFEKACDEPSFVTMWARLCRTMCDSMTDAIVDETVRDRNDKLCSGVPLFRMCLFNRCQEEFEKGWKTKVPELAAGEMMTDEYYVGIKAKRQGLGLIQFIGELFKQGMLSEKVMYNCLIKLGNDPTNAGDEEAESLCKLLSTVGQNLDSKPHSSKWVSIIMARMRDEMVNSPKLSSRVKFMIKDLVELRSQRWVSPNGTKVEPTTLAKIRESAMKSAR
ncbi:hypothetical protein G6F56_002727 [Rhizopus delemar]|nr:hypothetical protein G6F56_002727 [Rhizopus delemar]